MVTTVYLLRHGETDNNIIRRFQGLADTPLNERGHRQARLLGEALAEVPLTALYSSFLSRAKGSAREVAVFHPGLELQVLPGLEEGDVGRLQGLTMEEIAAQFPDVYQAMGQAPGTLQYPGGESAREILARAQKALASIIEANKGQTVAVVSHGFVIKCLLQAASGRPLEEMDGSAVVANASYCKLLFEEGEALPQIAARNCHEHLGAGDWTEFRLQ